MVLGRGLAQPVQERPAAGTQRSESHPRPTCPGDEQLPARYRRRASRLATPTQDRAESERQPLDHGVERATRRLVGRRAHRINLGSFSEGGAPTPAENRKLKPLPHPLPLKTEN